MLGSRWPQKPPVGTSIAPPSGLAQGLVAFWALNEGTGLPFDTASGHLAASNNATWTGSPYGAALAFNGTNQYVNLGSSTPWLNLTGPLTLACLAAPIAGSATNQQLIDGHTTTNQGGYLLVVNTSGNNEMDYYTVQGGSVASAASNSGAADGGWHVFAVSHWSTAANGVQFYRDGYAWGTATASFFGGSYTGQRTLGARTDAAAKWLSGGMAWAAIWSRALSAQEHLAMASNPWQVLRPQRDVASMSAARSGGRVSYRRGSSILLPLQLPTADLYCYLD
jgi:hypothetical protein